MLNEIRPQESLYNYYFSFLLLRRLIETFGFCFSAVNLQKSRHQKAGGRFIMIKIRSTGTTTNN